MLERLKKLFGDVRRTVFPTEEEQLAARAQLEAEMLADLMNERAKREAKKNLKP